MSAPPVLLVGFMGTGKTTVGRRLARRLGCAFLDMDAELERRAGKPLPRLFAEDGEPAFRRMERSLLLELASCRDRVIAGGGGVVLHAEALRAFAAAGRVVCLRAEPDELLRRVAAATHRPLLEQGDKEARLRALLEARQPLYDAIPFQVNTTGRSVNDVVEYILQRLAQPGSAPR